MNLFKKNETTNHYERVSLEAPWYSYCKKLQALFKLDDDIEVGDVIDLQDDEYSFGIGIEVRNHEKFQALSRLMPEKVTFGNVNVRLDIFDEENVDIPVDELSLFETLFDGNPLVKDIRSTVDQAGTKHSFVRFQPEVIQFFDDNLQDYNGNWTGLAQDIAREVFAHSPAVNFCTADIREKETTPLGEWP